MATSLKRFLKSFTLIELIIVIAIIAILGASAFLVLSQWMSKSRDSRKIADLGTIDTAINVSYTSKDILPTPDNLTNITFGGAKIWELGFFGDDAVSQIGGALTKTPSDPTTKSWYRYAVWNNKYQLGTIIENETFSKYLNRTYAQSYFTKVQGNYNQSIIVAKIGADDVIIPAPSLIVDDFEEGNKELVEEYFWINKNSYNLGQEQSNTLLVQSLFSGNINDLKDPDVFDEFKTNFKDIFSGTVYMKELTPDLDENKIEEIVSAELKKVSTQNVSVQYLSCDGISHGQNKVFYKENNVAFGQNCDLHKKEFKCENGVWKDGSINAELEIYKYFTCTVGPASNCESTTNNQTSLSGLSIAFNIPITEHGLGFNIEQSVNENNGTYKYALQGNCNNGTLESITLGTPVVQSCDSGYIIQGNNCGENTYWSGDATNGFTFTKLGQIVYPKSCNDILTSSLVDYKYGTNRNGSNFLNGYYKIKLTNNNIVNLYCDMTNDGGGWTRINQTIASSTISFTAGDKITGNNVPESVCNSTAYNFKISNLLITDYAEMKLDLKRYTSIIQCAKLGEYINVNTHIGTKLAYYLNNGQRYPSNTCAWGDGYRANATGTVSTSGLKLDWKLMFIDLTNVDKSKFTFKSTCSNSSDNGKYDVWIYIK